MIPKRRSGGGRSELLVRFLPATTVLSFFRFPVQPFVENNYFTGLEPEYGFFRTTGSKRKKVTG